MKIEEIKKLKSHYELFCAVMDRIPKKEGITITFTPNNVFPNDRFLIFSAYKKQKVTIKWKSLLRVYFDGDNPMLLEEVPESFLRSILLNIDDVRLRLAKAKAKAALTALKSIKK